MALFLYLLAHLVSLGMPMALGSRRSLQVRWEWQSTALATSTWPIS